MVNPAVHFPYDDYHKAEERWNAYWHEQGEHRSFIGFLAHFYVYDALHHAEAQRKIKLLNSPHYRTFLNEYRQRQDEKLPRK